MGTRQVVEVPRTPILIVGATSKTGFTTIGAILASSSHRHILILAVTRNVNSPRAKALAASSPAIRLVRGDLNDSPAIYRDALEASDGQPIHAVFSNAMRIGPGWTAHREIAQEEMLINYAVVHDIRHFVLSSIDRGPPPSLDAPVLPAHFQSKQVVEDYLRAATASNPTMTHTILRQTCLMENLSPTCAGRAFATWWKHTLAYTKPLALVSALDVGRVAAAALQYWCHPAYHNTALTLAADHLTFAHASRICKRHRGYDLPCAPDLIARFLQRSATAQAAKVADVLRWCDALGFSATQIPALRRLHPGLLAFGDWLEKGGSGFVDKRKLGK